METAKARVGVLATMIELYRRLPGLQPRMERWAGELVDSLRRFAEVIYPGVCDTREAVDGVAAELQRRGVDLLVVFPLTYAPSHLVLPALRSARAPVLLLNSQPLDEFPGSPAAAGGGEAASSQVFLENQAPTGLFDLANVLGRAGIPFQVASGSYRDPELLEELEDWCRVAAVASAARRLRIGLAGHAMDGMGDLAADHTQLLADLGAE